MNSFGLAVFAGLSLNLIIRFGLGAGIAGKKNVLPLLQIANIFVSVVFLWIIFTYVLNFFSWEFTVFFLMFPSSVIVCMGIEFLIQRLVPKKMRSRLFTSLTAYDGLITASLIITWMTALTLLDAVLISFFFAAGCLFAVIFMNETRRKSFLERIPENFRGIPMAFISLGLLSMVMATAAWICGRIIGGN